MYGGPGNSRYGKALTLVALSIYTISLFFSFSGGVTGIRDKETQQVVSGLWNKGGNITSIGDLNQDGFVDVVLSLPYDDTYGEDSGSVHLFKGTSSGFSDLRPSNADVTLHGEQGYMLGTSLATWDLQGNGWEELVIGCPGANDSEGRVFIFDQVNINGAGKGTVYNTSWAYMELGGTHSHGFGSDICKGFFTTGEKEDLVILSKGNSSVEPQLHFFMGGGVPGLGINMTLPPLSVSEDTDCVSIDLMGRGTDAFVFSTPDRASLRVVYFNVNETVHDLPGSNSTGVIDFESGIPSTGDTYGWGVSDDGWDRSESHVFDTGTGPDSIRFNQATGNARGHNRSVDHVNRLEIEIGGIFSSSSGSPESGAYGFGFNISDDDLVGKNSAVLSFDYEWEDWGFEKEERMWIKGRITDGAGESHWLGSDLDFNPAPDDTPEIWSIKGVTSGGSGIAMSGGDHHEEEIIEMLGPEGEHYLEIGGKISRWTNQVECGAVCFDNISLTLRSVDMDMTQITGTNGLGTTLLSRDVDGDGSQDLISGNPGQDRVRIFFGNDTYWDSFAGFNEDRANVTINGPDGSGLGNSVMILGPSPFTINSSVFISMPSYGGDPINGSGAIARFDLPLEEGILDAIDDGFLFEHGENEFLFGLNMVSIGDHDSDDYPDFLVISLDDRSEMEFKLFDRGPNIPELRLNSPQRGVPLGGIVEIKATMDDPDLDSSPDDIRFYLSRDNRSWSPVGNGTPDEVIGRSAVKYWDTITYENGLYFIKVEITDAFGLSRARYSNSVEVLNHRKPSVFLTYPPDGIELSGKKEITARIIPPSGEDLLMPVRFLLSRDGDNWTEFANRSAPVEGSSVDYSVLLDTESLEDGDIWFKANASTEFGLGAEKANMDPCYIDNYYPPVIEFTTDLSGNLSGVVNITSRITDRDLDIVQPVRIFIKDPDVLAWDLLGEMSYTNDTYHYLWDTSSVNNGLYDLMIRAEDTTFNEVELTYGHSVTVHNLYAPNISFVYPEEGSIVSGIPRLKVRIADADMNFERAGIRLFYRDPDVGIWNRITPVKLTGMNATVDWDTNGLKNKGYDLRAEVVDMDNNSAHVELLGVMVRNIIPPSVEGELFPSGPVSGVKRIEFNVTDDEPVTLDNITVEVYVFSGWREIGPVELVDPEIPFTSGENVGYFVDWDTTELDGTGARSYPDGPGYEIRITITDSDGETDTWNSVVSYKVENDIEEDKPETEDDDSSLDPGLLAGLVLIGIILLVLLVVGLFIWRGSRSEKKGSIDGIEDIKPRKVEEPPREEKVPKYRERDDDIYSPPGWAEKDKPDETTVETPDLSIEEASLFMGGGTGEEMTGRPTADIFDNLVTVDSGRPSTRKSYLDDIEVDVPLPEGAKPRMVKEEAEDWGEAEDWDEEEEDWEEFEEMEEMEDEDEWEEEEEEVLVVNCKCGEEIEIPTTGNGRFECPRCGRTGRVKLT